MITVSGLTSEEIGTHTIAFDATFQDCAFESITQNSTLDLTVVCDEDNSALTFIEVAGGVGSWTQAVDIQGELFFDYSHYYCGLPTLSTTVIDSDGATSTALTFSHLLVVGETQVEVAFPIENRDQIGTFTMSASFTEPVV
jgi:hypothetical protein